MNFIYAMFFFTLRTAKLINFICLTIKILKNNKKNNKIPFFQAEYKKMIEEAGFRRVRYENLTFGVTAIHSGFKI